MKTSHFVLRTENINRKIEIELSTFPPSFYLRLSTLSYHDSSCFKWKRIHSWIQVDSVLDKYHQIASWDPRASDVTSKSLTRCTASCIRCPLHVTTKTPTLVILTCFSLSIYSSKMEELSSRPPFPPRSLSREIGTGPQFLTVAYQSQPVDVFRQCQISMCDGVQYLKS